MIILTTNKYLQKNFQKNMKYKLFVDSDVVIDFFTDRTPHVNPASELFELNEQGIVKLFLSAVSINNIYYIVTNKNNESNINPFKVRVFLISILQNF